MNWRSLTDDEREAVGRRLKRSGAMDVGVKLLPDLRVAFVRCLGAKDRARNLKRTRRETSLAFTVCLLRWGPGPNEQVVGVAKRQPTDRELGITGERCALQGAVYNLIAEIKVNGLDPESIPF